MAYKVIYLEVASIKTKKAKAWYRRRQDGLQKRFVASVKEAVLRLQANAEAYAIRYRNIRVAHSYKLPFSIHFCIDHAGSQIVITNMIHDYRDGEF